MVETPRIEKENSGLIPATCGLPHHELDRFAMASFWGLAKPTPQATQPGSLHGQMRSTILEECALEWFSGMRPAPGKGKVDAETGVGRNLRKWHPSVPRRDT